MYITYVFIFCRKKCFLDPQRGINFADINYSNMIQI